MMSFFLGPISFYYQRLKATVFTQSYQRMKYQTELKLQIRQIIYIKKKIFKQILTLSIDFPN